LNRKELLQIGAAFALAALALTIWVGAAGVPLPGDIWITKRIQEFEALHRNEALINGFGDARLQFAALLAFGVLYAFGHRLGMRAGNEAQRVGAIVAIVAVVLLREWSVLLKRLVESPRPNITFGVQVDRSFGSWGFPSGHVYSDVLIYGAIAALAPVALGRRSTLAVRGATIVLLILSGPARIVVGAHWPSDVAGGYLWGGAALCLALWAGRTAARAR
jgi:membrane-associated phospholipid phosphatase